MSCRSRILLAPAAILAKGWTPKQIRVRRWEIRQSRVGPSIASRFRDSSRARRNTQKQDSAKYHYVTDQ